MAGASGPCIRCGRCLTVCPLFRATGREELAPRSKAMLLEALDQAGAPVAPLSAERLAGLCLGCHRCVEACPQGLDAPAAVSALRAAHPDFRTWLWQAMLRRPGASLPLAAAAPRALVPESLNLAGLEPPAEGPWVEIGRYPTCFQGRKAVLFSGCAASGLTPRWREKALGLLQGLGVELVFADFGCCGLPQESAGLLHVAEASRGRIADQWRRLGEPVVVAICATCRQGLLRTARTLGGGEGRRLEQAVTPLSALLAGSDMRRLETAPLRVALHRPCHQAGPEDEALLTQALGDRVAAPAADACCGFGGALRLARPDLAGRVGGKCWDALLDTGAENAVTGCTACAMALSAQAPEGARAFHWLDLFQ